MVSLTELYNIKEASFSELKKDRDPARGNKGKTDSKDYYFVDEPADPETGQIVKTNKNSSFRRRWEQKSEAIEETLDDVYGKLESIESWKHTVTRILWIVFTAIAGIAAKMVFGDVFTL